jgi:hypothetical protein
LGVVPLGGLGKCSSASVRLAGTGGMGGASGAESRANAPGPKYMELREPRDELGAEEELERELWAEESRE